MIEKLVGKREQECITLISDVTYSQVVYWFNNTMKPMKLSLLLPKDRPNAQPRPLLVWLCGGGFKVMQKDIWIPQMVSFAKRGYIVASVEYRTNNEGVYPDPIVDIKAAIRYLRAHAKEFFIDPTRVVLGGESAGSCLALMAAASDGISVFEQGDYLDQPSNVQAIIDVYGSAYLDYANKLYPGGIKEYGVASELLSEKFPPTIILHGDQDVLVDINDSYKLHDKLGELGVPCEMLVFEGTGHGEDVFYQEDIYDRICTFLDKVLK